MPSIQAIPPPINQSNHLFIGAFGLSPQSVRAYSKLLFPRELHFIRYTEQLQFNRNKKSCETIISVNLNFQDPREYFPGIFCVWEWKGELISHFATYFQYQPAIAQNDQLFNGAFRGNCKEYFCRNYPTDLYQQHSTST